MSTAIESSQSTQPGPGVLENGIRESQDEIQRFRVMLAGNWGRIEPSGESSAV